METWKPVVGREGEYEVSDYGRVRSLDRVIVRRNGWPQTLKGQLRTPQPHGPTGHLRVRLGRGTPLVSVHVLVLEAFVGPRPAGMLGCHEDDVVTHNWLSNLRWATPAANQADAVHNGRNGRTKRSRCPRGHLLELPNLVAWSWEHNGQRSCLSCQRTSIYVRWLRTKKGVTWSVEQFRTMADRRYAEIMDHAA